MYSNALSTGEFAGRAFGRAEGFGAVRIETRIHLLRAAESRERIYAARNARSGLRRARSKFALSASRVSYPRSYLDITAGALTHLTTYSLVHIMLYYRLGYYIRLGAKTDTVSPREKKALSDVAGTYCHTIRSMCTICIANSRVISNVYMSE